MNIEEFVHMFDDVIPHRFKLKIGGKKASRITNNKDFISYENRKGKVYSADKQTLLGTTTEYIPLEKIDFPIELSIECTHPHYVKWEKIASSTNKERTSFQARVLSQDFKRQYGYLSLELTAAGDIDHKFCSFANTDGTHEIMQSVSYEYDKQTKQVIPFEYLIYDFKDWENGLEKKVTFYKENGILKGLTISKQKLRNHMYDSIVWSDKKVKEQCELFSRYSNHAQVENATPLVCDMTNYIINKDFTATSSRLKDLYRLLEYKPNSSYPRPFDYVRVKEEIKYLSNPENDIFSGFYGEYIGNTVIKNASKLILIVETLKDNYHYFTSVDITDTNAFDIDFLHDRNEGDSYYEAIMNSDKKPMFRTCIQDGEDILVPLGEQITEAERNNFELFKSYCPDSFSTLQKKELSTLPFNRHPKQELEKGIPFIKS